MEKVRVYSVSKKDIKHLISYFLTLPLFSSKEIMIVLPSKEWWRLYWNTISEMWVIEKNTNGSWEKIDEIEFCKIQDYVSKFDSSKALGIQYRTKNSLSVYRVNDPTTQICY
jgi:hypothetical protein